MISFLVTRIPPQTFTDFTAAAARLEQLHDEALVEWDRAFKIEHARLCMTILVNDGSGPGAVIAQIILHDNPGYDRPTKNQRRGKSRPNVVYNLNWRHSFGDAIWGMVKKTDSIGIGVTWITR